MRTAPPPAPWATIVAHYPPERGTLVLRGSAASLDWNRDKSPDQVDGDASTFHISVPQGGCVEAKLVRSDGAWMVGVNVIVGAGENLTLRPSFDSPDGQLESARTIDVPGGRLTYRVMLPPSYGEQTTSRYPVIYAQDAQSLWSDGVDPMGSGSSTGCSTRSGTSVRSPSSSSSRSTPRTTGSSVSARCPTRSTPAGRPRRTSMRSCRSSSP